MREVENQHKLRLWFLSVSNLSGFDMKNGLWNGVQNRIRPSIWSRVYLIIIRPINCTLVICHHYCKLLTHYLFITLHYKLSHLILIRLFLFPFYINEKRDSERLSHLFRGVHSWNLNQILWTLKPIFLTTGLLFFSLHFSLSKIMSREHQSQANVCGHHL